MQMTPQNDSLHSQCGVTGSYVEVSLRAGIKALIYVVSLFAVVLSATLLSCINYSIALVASKICDVFITTNTCVNRM